MRLPRLLPLLLAPLLPAPLLPAQAEPPPGMVLVPAGEFTMGSADGGMDEAPAHRVRLSSFYIDRCEVTNAQFAAYVRAAGAFDHVEGPWFRTSVEGCVDVIAHSRQHHPDPATAGKREAARWQAAVLALRAQVGGETAPDGDAVQQAIAAQAALPVRFVTWRDAAAYARHVGKRLPTEAEWEKAARGTDARVYPWGNDWRPQSCCTGLAPPQAAVFDPYRFDAAGTRLADGTLPGPSPVGRFAAGQSPYGALDMAGNLWEWTADWYGERTYQGRDGAVDPKGPEGLADGKLPEPTSDTALLGNPAQGREEHTRKVIRGGGWSGPPNRAAFDARTARRSWSNPSYWHGDVGFRCAMDAK